MRDRRRKPFDQWTRNGPWLDPPPEPPRRPLPYWLRLLRIPIALALAVLVFFHDARELGRLLLGPSRTAEAAAPSQPVRQPTDPGPDPRRGLPRAAMPIGNMSNWFSSDDYPASALRESVSGLTRVRYMIDAKGRVTACAVIDSSGSPLLDATTCGILQQHGRYWPARDLGGRAVSSWGRRVIIWRLPTD